MKSTQISNSQWAETKQKATNMEILRKEVNLRELTISNFDTILLDGVHIKINDTAWKQLLSRIRMPRAFANRFANNWGGNVLFNLIEFIKTSRDVTNDGNVTLVVNPETRTCIGVLPQGYASISNINFLDFVEQQIGSFNLTPTLADVSYSSAQVNCIAPNSIFKLPNDELEVFQTGVTFTNSASRGLEIRPFVNRLVCSNGLVVPTASDAIHFNAFTSKSIETFNREFAELSNRNFIPSCFADTVLASKNTQASMSELIGARRSILNRVKDADLDYIERYVPVERATRAYNSIGIDLNELTNGQLRTAKAGVTVWDVVGGMTNFASNSTRYKDSNTGGIMIDAGTLLTKNIYDQHNQISRDPFNGGTLLSDYELEKVRGE